MTCSLGEFSIFGRCSGSTDKIKLVLWDMGTGVENRQSVCHGHMMCKEEKVDVNDVG